LRTSCPDSALSFGMDKRFELEGCEHRWILGKIEIR
jgi:hypothetical protein